MWRQLAPFNFVGILLVDLPQPAFIGGYVTRTTRRACLRAIDDHDGFVGHAAGESEDGRARKWSSLAPRILFQIVDLHIIYWTVRRPASDEIHESAMSDTGDRIIHGSRYVLAARPAVCVHLVNGY